MSASATFEAGHTISASAHCARPGHGHHYEAKVVVSGDLDPETGWPRGTVNLCLDLDELTAELDGENLNELLPGVVTSPLGIATYIQEQLLMNYPGISAVIVTCSDGTEGTIRRTPRQ